MSRVVTSGTFDVFLVGHLNILERTVQLGNHPAVGALNFFTEQRNPAYDQTSRMHIVRALRCVDDVFSEEFLGEEARCIQEHQADIPVVDDDWKGHLDSVRSICEVTYPARTPSLPKTAVIEKIRS